MQIVKLKLQLETVIRNYSGAGTGGNATAAVEQQVLDQL